MASFKRSSQKLSCVPSHPLRPSPPRFPSSSYKVSVNYTLLSLIYSTFPLSRLRFPYLRLNNGEQWLSRSLCHFLFLISAIFTFVGRTLAYQGGPGEISLSLWTPCPCEAKPGILFVLLRPIIYSSPLQYVLFSFFSFSLSLTLTTLLSTFLLHCKSKIRIRQKFNYF